MNGHRYVDSPAPLHEVGALLDAGAVHPGRSAYDHLLAMAATTGISRRRVDEVVELVGIGEVARKRVGGFSLGIGQRLGIAAALLGDPQTVTLDEPVNGLDPDGILWVRTLLKDLAAEGRTVFVSSHLMSEMALTAEHLVVVGLGRLIADLSVADFIHQAIRASVLVRSPQATQLRELLLADGATVASKAPGELEVTGLTSDQIGDRAAAAGLALHELASQEASLEEAFMEMTHHAVEYRGSASADRPERSRHARALSPRLLPSSPSLRRGELAEGHPVAGDRLRADQDPALWSTVYTLLATVVVVVGFGAVAALTSTGAIATGDGGPDGADFGTDPVAISLTGVMLAQLLIGVLGVLVITADTRPG